MLWKGKLEKIHEQLKLKCDNYLTPDKQHSDILPDSPFTGTKDALFNE